LAEVRFTSFTAEDTFNLGKKLAAHLQGGEVIALEGELGAGKTQFVKGMAAGLEAVETEIEQSEKRIEEIDDLLELPEVYTDHIRCQELHDEQERLNKKLDALYEEWSELSDI